MKYRTYSSYAFAVALAFGSSCFQKKNIQEATPSCSSLQILPQQGNYVKTTCLWDADKDGFPESREQIVYWNGTSISSETRYFQWGEGTSSLTKKVYSSVGKIQRIELDFNADGSPDEVIEFATLEGKVNKIHSLKNDQGRLVAVTEED